MVKLEFTKPISEDIQYIADNMWHEDRDELIAAGNDSVHHALVYSVEQSHACVVAKLCGKPLVIYGLRKTSVLTRKGVPWMITTTQSKQYQREYMVYTRKVVQAMMEECDSLVNYVHAKNNRSLKWLKALGFVIHQPVENPKTGEMFHRFTMNKEPVHV